MSEHRIICKKCNDTKTGAHVSYCKNCYNEYKRNWYLAHREQEISRCAEYNKNNPHVPAASMRRYRKKNPEKSKEYTNTWRSENKDRVYIYGTKKTAKRRLAINATIDKITAAEWRKIKLLHMNKCAYCLMEFKNLTMDHIVPLVKGGSHNKNNIVPACKSCNSSKQARDQLEFVRSKFGRLI